MAQRIRLDDDELRALILALPEDIPASNPSLLGAVRKIIEAAEREKVTA